MPQGKQPEGLVRYLFNDHTKGKQDSSFIKKMRIKIQFSYARDSKPQ